MPDNEPQGTAETVYDEDIQTLSDLLKAKGGNSDANEPESKPKDDYDEAYMQKHMARFMKKKGSAMKKNMGGIQKAMGDAQESVESMPEFTEAEATLVDGTSFMKAVTDNLATLAKAVSDIAGVVEDIKDRVEFNEELTKATGEVLVKATTGINNLQNDVDEIQSQPQPVKGQLAGQHMAKAAGVAPVINFFDVKQKLLKAATHDNSKEAGKVLQQLEAAGGVVARLPQRSMHYLNQIANAGV